MTSVSYALSRKSPEQLVRILIRKPATPGGTWDLLLGLLAALDDESFALGPVRGSVSVRVLASDEIRSWSIAGSRDDLRRNVAAERGLAEPYELDLEFSPLVYLHDGFIEAERCDVEDLYELGRFKLEPLDLPAMPAGTAHRVVGGPSETPEERLLYAWGLCSSDDGEDRVSLTLKSTSDFWRTTRFLDDYVHDHDVGANAGLIADATRRLAATIGATVTGDLLALAP